MADRAICLVVVDGRLPAPEAMVVTTQRFRGAILRSSLRHLLPDHERPRWEDLTAEQRDACACLLGKDTEGQPLRGGRHLALLPWYGDGMEPDRLYVWKRDDFTDFETTAILQAARTPVRHPDGTVVRFAPFGRLPLPEAWTTPSRTWRSLTPFVPVASRFRFRTNGSAKKSETPMKQARILCRKMDLPEPEVEFVDDAGPIRIHWTLQAREAPGANRRSTHWPGCRLELRFPEPVGGPLFLGHSCHFGLGLFHGAETP